MILGLVLGLWPRAAIPRPALVAGMCLGGLAVLAALSMTWAESNEDAFIAVVRVLAFLGLFVAVVLASSSGGARPWLLGLALGLGAVAVVAVVGRLQPGLFAAAEEIRSTRGARARAAQLPHLLLERPRRVHGARRGAVRLARARTPAGGWLARR